MDFILRMQKMKNNKRRVVKYVLKVAFWKGGKLSIEEYVYDTFSEAFIASKNFKGYIKIYNFFGEIELSDYHEDHGHHGHHSGHGHDHDSNYC